MQLGDTKSQQDIASPTQSEHKVRLTQGVSMHVAWTRVSGLDC